MEEGFAPGPGGRRSGGIKKARWTVGTHLRAENTALGRCHRTGTIGTSQNHVDRRHPRLA